MILDVEMLHGANAKQCFVESSYLCYQMSKGDKFLKKLWYCVGGKV